MSRVPKALIVVGLAVAVFAAIHLQCGMARDQSEDPGALKNSMMQLYQKGKFGEAALLAERYAEVTRARYGDATPQYASALCDWAGMLQNANQLAEAEPLYRRALTIYETNLGRDHPDVAIVLDNLAVLLAADNRLTQAEPLMRRALTIDEKNLGPDHPDVPTSGWSGPRFFSSMVSSRRISGSACVSRLSAANSTAKLSSTMATSGWSRP